VEIQYKIYLIFNVHIYVSELCYYIHYIAFTKYCHELRMGSVTSRTRAVYMNYLTTTWIRISYRIYSLLIYNHTDYDYNEHFSTRSFSNPTDGSSPI
jgi:hypothetical protein